MNSNTQSDNNFKYKTQSCKHFDDGKCKLGKRCRFAHGIIEKRAYNVFKFFNFFDDLAPIQNQNFIPDKENLNPNTPPESKFHCISELEKDLIFNLNPTKENQKADSTINSISSVKDKNEYFTETKKDKNACSNVYSNYKINKVKKTHKKKKQSLNCLKHKENKDTAHKFQQKTSKNNSKKNNLEILYADPEIADNHFKNLKVNFEKLSFVKKGKKAENNAKTFRGCKTEKEAFFLKDLIEVKFKGGIEILDSSNSDCNSDN